MNDTENFHFGYLLPTRGVVVAAAGEAPDTDPIFFTGEKGPRTSASIPSGSATAYWPNRAWRASPPGAAVLASTERVQVGTAVMLAALRASGHARPVDEHARLHVPRARPPRSGRGTHGLEVRVRGPSACRSTSAHADFSETVEILQAPHARITSGLCGQAFLLRGPWRSSRGPKPPAAPPLWLSSNLVDSGLKRVGAAFADGWDHELHHGGPLPPVLGEDTLVFR